MKRKSKKTTPVPTKPARREPNATYPYKGERLTITEIAAREGVNAPAIHHRLRRTGSVEATVKHCKHVLTKTRWDGHRKTEFAHGVGI
jgi:hypothetical protein